MLDVRNIFVRFAEFTANRDVTFSLPQGALLGLIGPNGAGKTTLLKAIAGLQPKDAGSVHLLGEELTEDRLHLVGFTPDTPPVWEELTVRQFLHVIGLAYNLEDQDIRDRTDFWLDKVWLSEKANQKLKGLSRGMRQRVGIARTLLPNPPLILLDEPAAGLDPAGRVQFRNLLVDLREQGKTLIVSSHILSDMPEYCTHIGIMSAGQLKKFGTVQQISEGLLHADGREGRRRYEIRLAHPIAQLPDQLAQIQGLSSIQDDRLKVVFEFGNTDDDAQTLLKTLLAKNLPLTAFIPLTASLEEAYLRENIRQVD